MTEAAHVELKPVAPNLIFPILDAASLADDELQKSWAALLTNAATTDFTTEVLPSFPDILRQLTPDEVRFLDTVEYEVGQDEATRRERIKMKVPGLGLPGDPYVSCRVRKNTLASVSRVMLGNLQRLGLLTPYREKDYDETERAVSLNPPTTSTSVRSAEHSCVLAVHLNKCCRSDPS